MALYTDLDNSQQWILIAEQWFAVGPTLIDSINLCIIQELVTAIEKDIV